MIGKFVTAKLKGVMESRQGWVIKEDPLLIRGVSGKEYKCEGEPVLVSNPQPKRMIEIKEEDFEPFYPPIEEEN